MKKGKLNWEDLEYIINSNRGNLKKDVRIRSGIGEDCSVINFGDYECVLSTDPITGASSNLGKLAVHINCNDIASCGVEPLGLLVTILAPENTSLKEIKKVMEEINSEAKELNVEILGGHTEVTDAVNKIIVSCTAVGKCRANSAVPASKAQVGDDIIVTKYLCMEGTTIIINDLFNKVKDVLKEEEIEEAKGYEKELSVVKEGIIAGGFGVNSMHDITEGGVLGALFEISEASNVGFIVYSEKMPVSEVTKKVCNKLKIDPLRFISSGSMLITTKNGEELIKKLEKEGIRATIIGKVIKDDKLLCYNNIETKVEPPKRDELFSIT